MYYIIYRKDTGRIIGWQKGAVPILKSDLGFFLSSNNNIVDKKLNLVTEEIEDISELEKLTGSI